MAVDVTITLRIRLQVNNVTHNSRRTISGVLQRTWSKPKVCLIARMSIEVPETAIVGPDRISGRHRDICTSSRFSWKLGGARRSSGDDRGAAFKKY